MASPTSDIARATCPMGHFTVNSGATVIVMVMMMFKGCVACQVSDGYAAKMSICKGYFTVGYYYKELDKNYW
jgi:hypothetical protein